MRRKAGAARQLAALPRLSDKKLVERFQRFYPDQPASRIARPVLEAAVAYRLQKTVIAQLHLRAIQAISAAEAVIEALSSSGDTPVLIGQWKRRSHIVTVLDDAVIYQGESYRSLDEVARVITGGSVSADALFGLNAGRDDDRG